MDYTKAKLSLRSNNMLIKCIHRAMGGVEKPCIFSSKAIQEAMKFQQNISFNNFIVGFLSDNWAYVLTRGKLEQQHTVMEQIFSMI